MARRITTVFLLLICWNANGQAAAGIQPHHEYRKRIAAVQEVQALDKGLFGEQVNLYSGSTTFTVTDIDLPGNHVLPVQLARYLAVEAQPQAAMSSYDTRLGSAGNWNVDVPYVAATYPQLTGWTAQRCTTAGVPDPYIDSFNRLEHWQGISVHVPGRGDTSVLSIHVAPQVPRPSNGTQYRFATAERDSFDCIPMQSGLTGEGFRMTTVGGLRYYFDVAVSRRDATLKRFRMTLSGVQQPVLMVRYRHYVLASKVEDRFGNTVQYQYNTDGHPTRIWSSDGREITLTYANNKLAMATAHGRTWQYQYGTEGNLTTVTLPDNSQWTYAYTGTLFPLAGPSEAEGAWEWCQHEPSGPSSNYQLGATHPSGAQGTFQFLRRRHYRSGVHANECMSEGDPQNPIYTLLTPNFFDVVSLQRKDIGGAGVPTATWLYDYGIEPQSLWQSHTQPANYPCTTCTQHKTVTVTNPDGTKLRQRFGIVYRLNDGRQLLTETLEADGTVLRSEAIEYVPDAAVPNLPFYGVYGSQAAGLFDPIAIQVRPVVARTITQQGRSFKWQVASNCGTGTNLLCFDAYARPTKVVKSSGPSP